MNAHDIGTTLRARAVFDASVEHLDADTRRRLRSSRLQALDGSVRPNRMGWMWPAGMATAAALALAVFIPYIPHAPVTTDAVPVPVKAIPLGATSVPAATVDSGLTANAVDVTDPAPVETADPDMLSELEFYGWLARQQDDTNHIGG